MRERQEAIKVKKEKRDRATVIEDDDEEGEEGDVTIESESRGCKRQRTSHDSGVELVDLTED